MNEPIRVKIVVVPPQYAGFARALLGEAVSTDGYPFRVLTNPCVPEDTLYLLPGEEVDGQVWIAPTTAV